MLGMFVMLKQRFFLDVETQFCKYNFHMRMVSYKTYTD